MVTCSAKVTHRTHFLFGQKILLHFLTLINGLLHFMHSCDTNYPYKYSSNLHKFSFDHLTFSHSLFFYNVLPPVIFHTKMLL